MLDEDANLELQNFGGKVFCLCARYPQTTGKAVYIAFCNAMLKLFLPTVFLFDFCQGTLMKKYH